MSKKTDDECELRTTFGGKAPLTVEDIKAAEERAATKTKLVWTPPRREKRWLTAKELSDDADWEKRENIKKLNLTMVPKGGPA